MSTAKMLIEKELEVVNRRAQEARDHLETLERKRGEWNTVLDLELEEQRSLERALKALELAGA